MKKQCVTCKWEPIWSKNFPKNTLIITCDTYPKYSYAGKCRCPIPNTLKWAIGSSTVYLGDDFGRDCEAWQAVGGFEDLK